MSRAAGFVDGLEEALVVPSFTRIGCVSRARLDHWTSLDAYDLSGRVVVVTGATSGLGLAAARRFAAAGATLVLVGRNPDKTERVRRDLATAGDIAVTAVLADMGELDDVRRAATEIAAAHDGVDALIHNAGALGARRRVSSDGVEQTVASQVVGPFLLTSLLLDRLRSPATGAGRVLTMSSGGMYTAPLSVGGLEMGADDYRGSVQYARAKRAQVTLNEMWAERFGRDGIRFHALHPGWADTPGVADALPTFRRVVGPLLRTPDEGADSLVWLAADDGEPLRTNGRFWHDRRPRPLHRLPATRRSDTPERRRRLWHRIAEQAGIEPR